MRLIAHACNDDDLLSYGRINIINTAIFNSRINCASGGF